MCGNYFFQYGFMQVCIFYLFIYKTIFLSFCVFCVYFFCMKFDVILNFFNISIMIVYIVGVRCFCSHLLEANCRNKYMSKIWLQLSVKNIPSESFWVLKIYFVKKNVGIHKMKECKRDAINKYFFPENLRSVRFILDL